MEPQQASVTSSCMGRAKSLEPFWRAASTSVRNFGEFWECGAR
jgi:hypothetical protein